MSMLRGCERKWPFPTEGLLTAAEVKGGCRTTPVQRQNLFSPNHQPSTKTVPQSIALSDCSDDEQGSVSQHWKEQFIPNGCFSLKMCGIARGDPPLPFGFLEIPFFILASKFGTFVTQHGTQGW